MAPGEEVVDDRLADELLADEHPEQLRAIEPLAVLGVEPNERQEGAVASEDVTADDQRFAMVEDNDEDLPPSPA